MVFFLAFLLVSAEGAERLSSIHEAVFDINEDIIVVDVLALEVI